MERGKRRHAQIAAITSMIKKAFSTGTIDVVSAVMMFLRALIRPKSRITLADSATSGPNSSTVIFCDALTAAETSNATTPFPRSKVI